MSTRARQRRRDREIEKFDGENGAVIGWISSGMVHHDFMSSFNGSLLHDVRSGERRIVGPRGGFLSLKSSPRIVAARTQLVSTFLTSPEFEYATWLVTIDSDMMWHPTDIHDMLNKAEKHDRAVVGGLCVAGGHSDDQYVTAYVAKELTDDGLPIVERFNFFNTQEMIDAVDGGSSMMVDATGAAFMAIRRDVLIAMVNTYGNRDGREDPHPWYAELAGPMGQEFGEDIVFCLRARQLGYPVWLDMSIKVGHNKIAPLTWDSCKALALANQEPADV